MPLAAENGNDSEYEVSFCVRNQQTKLCTRHSQCENDQGQYTLMNGSISDESGAYSLATDDAASGHLSRSVSKNDAAVTPEMFEDSGQDGERRLYAVVSSRRRERNRSGREAYTFANDIFRRSPSSPVSIPPSIPEASPYVFASEERQILSGKCAEKKLPTEFLLTGISLLALLGAIAAIVIGVIALNQVNSVIQKASQLQVTNQYTLTKAETPTTVARVNHESSSSMANICSVKNPCHPEGGICIDIESGGYGCVCRDGWTGDGKNCTEITYPTCAALRKVVGYNTGYYRISPDPGRVSEVVAKCVMERERGVTEIDHDSEAQTLVNGCDSPGCYSRNITYHMDMDIVEAIIAASNHCSQYIKYKCYHSSLAIKGTTYAWWISRQGTKETHWAEGAAINSCACSLKVNATCPGCYCNANDSTYRIDEGYITNKTLLPIMQLRYGDVGESWEDGFHTLGKLRCYD